MRRLLGGFAGDECGANALEYALVMIFVAMAIIGGAGALGTNINALFSGVAAQVGTASVPNL